MVRWNFADIIEGGWARREEIVFEFVDMKEDYPFMGTGNLEIQLREMKIEFMRGTTQLNITKIDII